MADINLPSVHVVISSHIATVKFNHPPINLLDEVMAKDLDEVTRGLERDPQVRVVIFQRAIPEFFSAHSGLGRVMAGPKDVSMISITPNFRQTQILTERWRNMGKVTIAKVEGIARGGGDEIVLGCDMAFAARGKAIFGQPEVMVGVVPGGGSTQRLPALVGRARALEILLGGEDFSVDIAAQMGWVNRALDPEELGPFVDKLAKRIASYPAHALARIKAAVNKGAASLMPAGLLTEAHEADLCVASDITRKRVTEGLGMGIETFEGELDLPAYAARLSPC